MPVTVPYPDLYLNGRTHGEWLDRPVDPDLIREAYEQARMAPTSANCSPMRLVLVTSPEARERLRPHLSPGNVDKTMNAPVCAIVAHDMAFYDRLPTLFPHADARSWFVGDERKIAETALRNGSLQAAYFITALRAVGLDCGPMSGFDAAGVDAEFLSDTAWKSNFLCNIGHGDPARLHPRAPRLDFRDIARVV